MRYINSELERRLKLLQQTAYGNADPSVKAHISRSTTPLTQEKFLDRTLVGEFSGLSASSIAVRRPRKGWSADRVYVGYVANGVASVKWAKAMPDINAHVWNDGGFSAPAIDIALAFDGTMPKKAKGAEFVTSERPWVFWVTLEGALKGRILGLLGDTTLAESNCTKVSAIRATWSSDGSSDFGLVVFFLLNGSLYYRQLIDRQWGDAVLVTFGPASVTWVDIAAFRTWDYRIGVQAIDSNGNVYELFTQYQGIAKHGTEHIQILNSQKVSTLTEITYHNVRNQYEHIQVVSASWGALYGGLYASGAPVIVNAYNIADTNNDWGTTAIFVFDKHLVAAEVAAQYSSFRIVDSLNVPFVAVSATLGQDGKTVTLTFLNYNNANGVCQAKYIPGTVTSMAGTTLTATNFSWVPENLVPTGIPAPEVDTIVNIGFADLE